MATGIKDKVAILGMGCSNFGERWVGGLHMGNPRQNRVTRETST